MRIPLASTPTASEEERERRIRETVERRSKEAAARRAQEAASITELQLGVPGAIAETDDARMKRALANNQRRTDVQKERMRIASRFGSQLDPDAEAEAQRLGVMFPKLPLPTIRRNLEELKKFKGSALDLESILKRSPSTAKLLQNPDTAGMIVDDVANLQGLEWVYKAPFVAYQQGKAQLEHGQLTVTQMANTLAGKVRDEKREARIQYLEREVLPAYLGQDMSPYDLSIDAFKGITQRGWVEAWKMLPYALGAARSAGIGGVGGVTLAAVAGINPFPEEAATVPIGFAAGASAGAMSYTTVQETGPIFRDIMFDENGNVRLDADGNQMDPKLAAAAATMAGGINGALEVLGMRMALKILPGGREALVQLMGGILKKRLNKKTFTRALGKFARDYAIGVGTETGTEGLQEISGIMAGVAAERVMGGEWESQTWAENWEQVAETTLRAFEGMAVGGTALAPFRGAVDTRSVLRARRNVAFLDAIAVQTKKIKLLERNPERLGEFSQELAEERGTPNVFYPVEKWNEHWLAEGVDPAEAALKVMGEPRSYREAMDVGGKGDLVIPLSTYTAKIGATEMHAKLLGDARLEQGGLSFNQLQEEQKKTLTVIDEAVKRDPKTFNPEEQAIYDAEYEQVLRARQDPAEADAAARVRAHMTSNLATRTGRDPIALYNANTVTVNGADARLAKAPEPAEGLRDDQLEDTALTPDAPAQGPMADLKPEEGAATSARLVDIEGKPGTGFFRTEEEADAEAARLFSTLNEGDIIEDESGLQVVVRRTGLFLLDEDGNVAGRFSQTARLELIDKSKPKTESNTRVVPLPLDKDAVNIILRGKYTRKGGSASAAKAKTGPAVTKLFQEPRVGAVEEDVRNLPLGNVELQLEAALQRAIKAGKKLTSRMMARLPGAPVKRKGKEKLDKDVRPRSMEDLERIAVEALKGKEYKNWYKNFAGGAIDLLGEANLQEFSILFGITSQQNSVENNTADTLHIMALARMHHPLEDEAAFRDAVRNRKRPGGQGMMISGKQIDNVVEAYKSGTFHGVDAGLKISTYSNTVMLAGRNEFTPYTVMDRHMARVMGWMRKDVNKRGVTVDTAQFPSDLSIRYGMWVTSLLAEKNNVTPHEMQEALWFWSRDNLSPSDKKQMATWESAVKNSRLEIEAIERLVAEGQLDKTRPLTMALADERHATFQSTTKKDPWNTVDLEEQLVRRAEARGPTLLLGLSPGTDRGFGFPEGTTLRQLAAYRDDLLESLTDQHGQLHLLRAMGIPHRVRATWGSWRGLEPTLEISLPGGSLETAALVGEVLGHALMQDSVITAQPKWDGQQHALVARKPDGSEFSDDEIVAALDKVNPGKDPAGINFTMTGDKTGIKLFDSVFYEKGDEYNDADLRGFNARVAGVLGAGLTYHRFAVRGDYVDIAGASKEARRGVWDRGGLTGRPDLQRVAVGQLYKPAWETYTRHRFRVGAKPANRIPPLGEISPALARDQRTDARWNAEAGLGVRSDGKVPLTHWGRTVRKVVDPAFFGGGEAGRERSRVEAGAPVRSYYGSPGYRKERRLGPIRKLATVHPGDLYDMQGDPLGLVERTLEASQDERLDLTEFENAIIAAGYKGYWNSEVNVVAVFEPLVVDEHVDERQTETASTAGFDVTGRQGKAAAPPLGDQLVAAVPGVQQALDATVRLFQGSADGVRRFFQSAFHGGRNKKLKGGKFDTEFIGTGEGNPRDQSVEGGQGWGLYFTSKKTVAEWYRGNLSASAQIKFDGGINPTGQAGELAASAQLVGGHFNMLANIPQVGDEIVGLGPRNIDRRIGVTKKIRDVAIGSHVMHRVHFRFQAKLGKLDQPAAETLNDAIRDTRDDFEFAASPAAAHALELARNGKDALAWLNANEARFSVQEQGGQVFEVDVPDDADLLDWRRGVTDQSQGVVQSLESLLSPLDEFMTGEDAYRVLARELGSTEEASKALLAAGIPGHIYKSNSGNKNYVIYSGAAIDVKRTFHQRREGGPPRGEIVFESGGHKFNINLFRNADSTTVFHESAHFYLELIGQLATEANADEGIVRDYNKILKWLKVEDRAGIGTAQHEKFAAGFEQYLREGKAPTLDLQDVFNKIRTWMISVYGKVSGLVDINDEIRGVFDRMIASEAEIKAARQQLNVQPMTPLQEGSTRAEWDAYIEKARASAVAADGRLRHQMLEELDRETKDWFEEEQSKMREQAANELNGNPVFRLVNFLQNGVLHGFDELPESLTNKKGSPLKLLLSSVLEASTIAAEIPEKASARTRRAIEKKAAEDLQAELPEGVTRKNSGIDVESAAAIFGFESGQHLVGSIRGAPNYNEALDTLTQRKVDAAFGNLMENKPELAQAALDAAQGPEHVEQVLIELRMLRREISKGAAKAISRQPVNMTQLKQRAQLDVAGRKFGDLRPHVYRSNAARHSTEAFELAERASKTKDVAKKQKLMAEAYDQKLLQLWNTQLYRATRDAKVEGEKIVRFLRRMGKKAAQSKLGKAGHDYLEQVNDILRRYHLRPESGKAVDARIEKRLSLRQFMELLQVEDQDAVFDEAVMDESRKVHYREVEMGELRGVETTVQNIAFLANLENSVLANGRRASKDAARTAIIDAMEENMPDRGDTEEDVLTKLQTAVSGISEFHARLIRVEELIRQADGDDPLGPLATYIFNPLTDANVKNTELGLKFGRKIQNQIDKLSKNKRKRLFKKRVHVPELGRSYTIQYIVALALNTGNASNYSRLLTGGRLNNKEWTPELINAALKKLEREDWVLVQGIWDTLEELWPEMEALEQRMTGLPPKRIEPQAFRVELEDGTTISMRGGYYPVVYRPEDPIGERQAEGARSVNQLYAPGSGRVVTPHGSLMERVAVTRGVVHLNMEIIERKMAEAIRDVSYREAVISVHSLLKDPEIRTSMLRHFGTANTARFIRWVKFLANPSINKSADHKTEAFLGGMRNNVTLSAIAFKTTTIAQNFANIFNVFESWLQRLGGGSVDRGVRPDYYAAATLDYMRWNGRRQLMEDVNKISGVMRTRFINLDVNIREAMMSLAGKQGMVAQSKRFAFSAMIFTDQFVAYPAWMGAYREMIDKGKSKEFALRHADRVVRTTLTSGAEVDIPDIQTGGAALKFYTLFYSWMSGQYMRYHSIGFDTRTAARDRRLLRFLPVAMARVFVLSFLAPQAAELLSRRGPDDDEGWVRWWMAKAAMAPLMTVPLVRDAAGGIERYVLGERPRDIKFGPVGLLEESRKAATFTLDRVFKDDEFDQDDVAEALKLTNRLLGYARGIPSGQIDITVGQIYEMMNDDEDRGFMEWILNLGYRDPERNK